MTTIPTTHVVVFAAGGPIYGLGEDEDVAKADARQWLDPDTSLDEIDWAGRRVISDGLHLAKATAALAAAVLDHGGDIAYARRVDGTLCLPEETA